MKVYVVSVYDGIEGVYSTPEFAAQAEAALTSHYGTVNTEEFDLDAAPEIRETTDDA